jgi:uncharacterized membrane protein YqaE (UPF0057 family)
LAEFLIGLIHENVSENSLKSSSNPMKLLRFVLGLLLPPLGVFLTVGIGPTLLINVLLTLLGWLPGSIHAIWVIAKYEDKQIREGETY